MRREPRGRRYLQTISHGIDCGRSTLSHRSPPGLPNVCGVRDRHPQLNLSAPFELTGPDQDMHFNAIQRFQSFVYYTNSRRSLSCNQIQEHSLERIQYSAYETGTEPVRKSDSRVRKMHGSGMLDIRRRYVIGTKGYDVSTETAQKPHGSQSPLRKPSGSRDRKPGTLESRSASRCLGRDRSGLCRWSEALGCSGSTPAPRHRDDSKHLRGNAQTTSHPTAPAAFDSG